MGILSGKSATWVLMDMKRIEKEIKTVFIGIAQELSRKDQFILI